jgi:DNA-binding MarR family transcriptional regulator
MSSYLLVSEFFAMPSDVPNEHAHMLAQLVNELRQSYGLSASFFRAAASRNDMTDSDMQVIALLESMGDATAGQLASVMGLTTGSFTAILNRLEKAGLVRRERDPNDGRRVIVRLATDTDGGQEMGPLFASLGTAWKALAETYTDEQTALLLAFLQRTNAVAREEITRLREGDLGDTGLFSAPLGSVDSGRLVFHGEGVRLSVQAAEGSASLYQARFEGPLPDVKVKAGVVTMRYPRRWLPGAEERVAEITLNTTIPWSVEIRSGGSEVHAELDRLDLREVAAQGVGSMFRFSLAVPSGSVPLDLSGTGSEFTVRRPQHVAARVQMKGWGSGIVLDDQLDTGSKSVQTPDFEDAKDRYDIHVSGTGSMITVVAN